MVIPGQSREWQAKETIEPPAANRQQPTSNFLPSTCTFALLKYQMLGSTMSKQAWSQHSPYAFVQPLLQNFLTFFRLSSVGQSPFSRLWNTVLIAAPSWKKAQHSVPIAGATKIPAGKKARNIPTSTSPTTMKSSRMNSVTTRTVPTLKRKMRIRSALLL